jgi:hypothetical protein
VPVRGVVGGGEIAYLNEGVALEFIRAVAIGVRQRGVSGIGTPYNYGILCLG